jgi:hypothetical protein
LPATIEARLTGDAASRRSTPCRRSAISSTQPEVSDTCSVNMTMNPGTDCWYPRISFLVFAGALHAQSQFARLGRQRGESRRIGFTPLFRQHHQVAQDFVHGTPHAILVPGGQRIARGVREFDFGRRSGEHGGRECRGNPQRELDRLSAPRRPQLSPPCSPMRPGAGQFVGQKSAVRGSVQAQFGRSLPAADCISDPTM